MNDSIVSVLNEMQLPQRDQGAFNKVQTVNPNGSQSVINYQMLMSVSNIHEALANQFLAQENQKLYRFHKDISTKIRTQASFFISQKQ